MKKHLFIGLSALLLSHAVHAETRLNKDLDGDNQPDSVWLQDDVLHIRLSAKQQTLTEHNVCDEPPVLKDARVGFIISCSAMRHGSRYHYAYNAAAGKMQYIGYDFWALGNAANEGGGSDSVNLKTGGYVAQWRVRDPRTGRLRTHKMKTRLSGVRPIDVDTPEVQHQWQTTVWDPVNAAKARHGLTVH